MPSTDFEARLVAPARESSWFWPALVAVQSLNLPSWCIGAGAVRNLVWDSLHGLETSSALPDVDVAYFDGADLSAERDATFQSHLSRMHLPIAMRGHQSSRRSYLVRGGFWLRCATVKVAGGRRRVVAGVCNRSRVDAAS
ncbi:nucleotidyltransferase family protein [Burkholderia gladioli]|uniref:nucleotidyltransferase family protein n=1 Tax=Burkholderia gladioli TaxID=28095 RepID=UPI0020979EE3|nr:nucleotidyltransferase family protein [Burkholderia gladioli]